MAQGNLKLYLTIVADLKDAYKKLDRFQARMRQFQRQTRFLYQTMAMVNRQLIFATLGVVGLGAALTTKAIRASAMFEDARNSLEVLIGDVNLARILLDDLIRFAATTPFELQEVFDAAQMLVALNVELDEVVPKLKMFGEAAKGLNKPLNQVVMAWQRLRSGLFATITMAPLGFARDTAKEWGIDFAKSGSMETAGKDAAKIFEKYLTEEFGGVFDRATMMLSGKMANLADEFTVAFKNFGDAISPVVKSILDKLIEMMQSIGDFFKDNTDVIVDALEPLTDSIDLLLIKIGEFLSELKDNPDIFIEWAKGIALTVEWLVKMLVIGEIIQQVAGLSIVIATAVLAIGKLKLAWIAAKAAMIAYLAARGAAAAGGAGKAAGIIGGVAGMAATIGVMVAAGFYAAWKQYDNLVKKANEAEVAFKAHIKTMNLISAEYKKVSTEISKLNEGFKEQDETARDVSDGIDELIDKGYGPLITELGLTGGANNLFIDSNGEVIESFEELQTIVNAFSMDKYVDEIKKATEKAQLELRIRLAAEGTYWKVVASTYLPGTFAEKMDEEYKAFVRDLKLIEAKRAQFAKDQAGAVSKLPGGKGDDEDDEDDDDKGKRKLEEWEKVLERFNDLMKDSVIEAKALVEMFNRGVLSEEELVEGLAKTHGDTLDRGIELYTELKDLNAEAAEGILDQLDAEQKRAIIYEDLVKKAKQEKVEHQEYVAAMKNEIEFIKTLRSIGADQVEQLQIALDTVDAKVELLKNEEDAEREITSLMYERLVLLQQLWQLRKDIADEAAREALEGTFDTQLRTLKQLHRIEEMRRKYHPGSTPIEGAQQKLRQLEERLEELQAMRKATPGGETYDAMRTEFDDMINNTQMEIEYTSAEISEMHKGFYRDFRYSLLEGIQELAASVATGDISSAIRGIFSQLAQFIQQSIVLEMGGLSLGSSLLSGLAGGAVGLIGGLLTGGLGGKKAAEAREVSKVRVVNWPSWMKDPYRLPGSFVSSGRGGIINVNTFGHSAGGNADRAGQRVADLMGRDYNRGANLID